ncbi:MAG: hypothetical protein KQJ78_23795 [Deltaproteobacteria bacterium]|nr:hypothetical protein [Deltaproteobacteria bacterium]
MAETSRPPVFSCALLVGGAAVGAGILGLPVQVGLAGFTPFLVGLLVLGLAMLATALVLARAQIRHSERCDDLACVFHQDLGHGGKWLATAGYLLNFYGILVAYLAGAAAVLSALLGLPEAQPWLLLGFFVVATGLTLFGLAWVRRGNAVVMAVLGASLVYLLVRAGQNLDTSRLAHAEWALLPSCLPLIMCSLSFHNIIPAVVRELGLKPREADRALTLGLVIPVLLGALWTLAVLGALPLTAPEGQPSLLAAFHADQPATVPLAQALDSPDLTIAGLVFSVAAIFTSYLAAGTGLMGYWRDLAPALRPERRRLWRAMVTFLPPLAVVYLWPDLFLTALNVAGGLGVAVVFGICPALILWRTSAATGFRAGRVAGLALLAAFLVLAGLEVAQEAGWLSISSQVENWTNYQPRP